MIDYHSPTSRMYVNVWNKYRPAVLRLMVDAAKGPQQYKFSPHEFRKINPKEKGGHSFTLRVFLGKAENNIKGLPVAKDLLEVLQQSNKAMELSQISTYEFILDKQFMFHVTRTEKAPEVLSAEPAESIEASA